MYSTYKMKGGIITHQSITFKKIVILFLAIMIPLFLISLTSIFFTNQHSKQTIETSIEQSIDETIARLENDFSHLYQLGAEFISQSNVRKVADMQSFITRYEQANTINTLREQQTSLCQANNYLVNLVVYYRDLEKAYNANLNNNASFFEFSESEWINEICSPTTAGRYYYHNGYIITKIKPAINASYLCELQIDLNQIWHTLGHPLQTYSFECVIELPDGTILKNHSSSIGPNKKDKNTLYFERTLSALDANIYFFITSELLFQQESTVFRMASLLLGCIILAVFIFTLGTTKLIRIPINNLCEAFDKIGSLNYSARIKVNTPSDFEVLYNAFNNMAKHLENFIEKEYEWKLAVNKAELRQLQSQINPHFLYNSFFTLRNLINDDLCEEALQLCIDLGNYYRYITRNTNDTVALKDEYEHACIYANIQNVRFVGRVQTTLAALPSEFSSFQVPKLIIQPLLENAYKYAFERKVSDGILFVSFTTDVNGLWITVEDNGDSITDEHIDSINRQLHTELNPQEMSALLNIQKRLQLFSYGCNHLEVTRSTLGGMKAMIWLEKEKNIC